jgi:hypothetical protein
MRSRMLTISCENCQNYGERLFRANSPRRLKGRKVACLLAVIDSDLDSAYWDGQIRRVASQKKIENMPN